MLIKEMVFQIKTNFNAHASTDLIWNNENLNSISSNSYNNSSYSGYSNGLTSLNSTTGSSKYTDKSASSYSMTNNSNLNQLVNEPSRFNAEKLNSKKNKSARSSYESLNKQLSSTNLANANSFNETGNNNQQYMYGMNRSKKQYSGN